MYILILMKRCQGLFTLHLLQDEQKWATVKLLSLFIKSVCWGEKSQGLWEQILWNEYCCCDAYFSQLVGRSLLRLCVVKPGAELCWSAWFVMSEDQREAPNVICRAVYFQCWRKFQQHALQRWHAQKYCATGGFIYKRSLLPVFCPGLLLSLFVKAGLVDEQRVELCSSNVTDQVLRAEFLNESVFTVKSGSWRKFDFKLSAVLLSLGFSCLRKHWLHLLLRKFVPRAPGCTFPMAGLVSRGHR